MRTVLYLNRWNNLFHLMLTKTDGETHQRLDSRFCRSLDEARRLLG